MKVEICPDCIDTHAERVVEMYEDLESPLIDIRNAKDKSKAREALEEWLRNALKLGFYKGHGKINIGIENNILHILDADDQRLCKETE